MEKKIELKKCIVLIMLVSVAIITIFLGIILSLVKKYNKNNNIAIAEIMVQLTERYPEISYNDMMEILEAKGGDSKELDNIFAQYGIDIESEAMDNDNSEIINRIIVTCGLCAVIELAAIVTCFLLYERKRDRDINQITKCIENINKKIYHIDVDGNTEDELSILKNEIYKTTIMLKEDAENAKLAKSMLKDSLSDISHQLKTPLTAITIMLDNLMEEPDMDANRRRRFIRDIRREISNINFMVQSLLKLSRLEANTVSFKEEETELSYIVEEAIKNVSALSDLRGVSINVLKADTKVEADNLRISCDRKWQIEAISNLLKNSVEHSDTGENVDIELSGNHVYKSIRITNYGENISRKDLPHIFERFYQGENATADSVGIGLSLAKLIIESCGGQITVDSEAGKTTFHLKYF